MGQNCVGWLVKIIKCKDIEVCMNGAGLVFDDYDFDSLCLNDGEYMTTGKELTDKMCYYAFEKG